MINVESPSKSGNNKNLQILKQIQKKNEHQHYSIEKFIDLVQNDVNDTKYVQNTTPNQITRYYEKNGQRDNM